MFVSIPDIKSSNVIGARYDSDSKTLEIEFKKRRVYHYFGVPESVVSELSETAQRGESVGKAFNSLVISGGYEYEELPRAD